MDPRLLINAIVQRTMVFLAQLATAGGVRFVASFAIGCASTSEEVERRGADPTANGTTGSEADDQGEAKGAGEGGVANPEFPCVVDECPDGVLDVERPKPGAYRDCPQTEPDLGGPCSLPTGTTCSYGEAHSALCRFIVECTGERWVIPFRLEGADCPEQNVCPEQPPSRGEHCVVGPGGRSVTCDYQDAMHCFCAGILGMADGTWACYGPPADTRCPELMPNFGRACADPALQCTYVIDPCLATRYNTALCYQGVWEPGAPTAPCAP